jgi:phage baseplate assembly protein W
MKITLALLYLSREASYIMSIGFTLPFAKSTGSLGYFEMTQDDVSAVREDLKSLLITNWGERVMHYSFGCNLIEFLFENNREEDVKERIADRIMSQVATWLPFVSVESLNIVFPEDDATLPSNSIGIQIKFRITNSPNLSSLTYVATP